MPIFEFKCRDCGKVFEVFFKSRDEQMKTECPSCHCLNAEKIFSVFGSRVEKTSAQAPSAPCSGCTEFS
ncbi:MAG: zinc ribbon domain-containing protein [Syntrophales bacterium]